MDYYEETPKRHTNEVYDEDLDEDDIDLDEDFEVDS